MIYPFESNPPSLSFEIGNGTTWTSLGQTIDLSDYDNYGPGEWYLTYADAQFGSTGMYYVRLKNSNGADGGNDLGLDDIYFGLRSQAPSYSGEPGVESPQVFNPATASVPEIDSAGMGSVVALVSGAFGLLERRRKRAGLASISPNV